MKYTELKVYGSSAGLELVTAIMLNHGIDYISVDDPDDFDEILNKKHEYGWDYIDDELKDSLDREPVLSVYFQDEEPAPSDSTVEITYDFSSTEGVGTAPDMEAILADIEELKEMVASGAYGEGFDAGRLHVEINVVDDNDWKDKWKEYFHPTHVTEHLVVKPSWEEYEPQEGDLIIEIDPGMAFGTGTHETTSLCMKLMDKYMGEFGEDVKVLDVGCGSGILSIAASRLGSKDVLGVEIDQDAVNVAIENIEINGCSDTVRAIQGDLTKGIDFKGHVIVANLMADLVMLLSESAKAHLEEGGIYISSGILVEKKEIVSEAIKAAGFEIVEIMEDGEWCAIAARG